MSEFWFDLGTAWRALARSPGYTVISLAMLASGLGLTIFMFSAVKGYIFTGLPFAQAERLMYVELYDPRNGDEDSVAPHYLADWRAGQRAFTDLAGYYEGTVNLSGDDRPERYAGAFVTANFFDVLGVAPALGRGFVADDDRVGAPLTVLIGHNLWRHRYNEDPAIVGRAVRVNGRDAVVIGVMPAGFRFPIDQDVWVPQQQDLAAFARGDGIGLGVVGRLRDGVTPAQARAALQPLHDAALAVGADSDTAPQVVVEPYAEAFVGDNTRTTIWTLFACVLFVLAIACSNVANLTLARVGSRRREIAVRASLGASRTRLVGGVLVEVLLVALGGAVLGLLFAHWSGIQLERAMTAADDLPPYWVDTSIDATTVAFAFAAAAASALVAGLVPAWRAAGEEVHGGLRDGGYGASDARQGRLGRALVVLQVALCCVLLICAGLTLRSMLYMSSLDDGLVHGSAITGRIGLFTDDADAQRRTFQDLQRELAALPGVRDATVTTGLPYADLPRTDYLPTGKALGPDQRPPWAVYAAVQPNYFDTFGVPLLRGRSFHDGDDADGAPVAIVNARFAADQWPGEDPLGRTLHVGGADGPVATVVGVVEDFVQDDDDLDLGIRPALYLPLAQAPARFVSFAATTDGDPARLASAVRDAMLRVDPDTPVYWLRTLDEVAAIAKFNKRFMASLFGTVALVGVLLAGSGMYAVLSFAVGQRVREIGVRRALGAEDRNILGMVLGQGARQVVIGLAIGLVLAALFARVIEYLLVGVSSSDPLTFAAVVVGLGMISLGATWLPARRALRIEPVVALRQD